MIDIRQYLHLYIGCDVYVFPDDTYSDGWLSNRLKEMPDLQYKIQLTHENFNHIVERGYKPLLRPLSSMTEEEAREFCKKEGWGENLENIVVTDGAIYFKRVIGERTETCVSRFTRCRPEMFAWLLSKGFDLFDLIPNGLAIEKNGNI